MKSEKEKQLEIQLLTEKIQRISGKRVIFEEGFISPKEINISKTEKLLKELTVITYDLFDTVGDKPFVGYLFKALEEGQKVVEDLKEIQKSIGQ